MPDLCRLASNHLPLSVKSSGLGVRPAPPGYKPFITLFDGYPASVAPPASVRLQLLIDPPETSERALNTIHSGRASAARTLCVLHKCSLRQRGRLSLQVHSQKLHIYCNINE